MSTSAPPPTDLSREVASRPAVRRGLSCLLALALAAVIHVDWHLARPEHHRLSLGWAHHWIFAAAAFAAIGWIIARAWPGRATRVATSVLVFGAIIAQIVEPVLEMVVYEGVIAYPDEPERWKAFAVCLAAGIPALYLAIHFGRRHAGPAASASP